MPRRSFMGDYASLEKTHEVSEFMADAGCIEVLKVVHIEAGHDPAHPLTEARWLQSLADTSDNRGIPQGIVAYADLARADAEQLLAARPLFRTCAGFARS